MHYDLDSTIFRSIDNTTWPMTRLMGENVFIANTTNNSNSRPI